MPAFYVCEDHNLWKTFTDAVIQYHTGRIFLADKKSRLPYVSGPSPFVMNIDGHKRYLKSVLAYRRNCVCFDEARLRLAHERGLFISNAIIQPDGGAVVPAGNIPVEPTVRETFRMDRVQQWVEVPNIVFSTKDYNTYSPFSAVIPKDWVKAGHAWVGSYVCEDVNLTTLGLYSFRIFVDCGWTAQKLKAAKMTIPTGRRPVLAAGKGNCKRPLANQIARSAAPKKRCIARDDNKENEVIDLNVGITTRSKHKLL
ncbi:hypothetical protein B0H10DRAFT_1940673 [Mycena sp. CBHHK59/15]|nr:hypothetical protein B0H10DRAFT_1940673 [Mycena sp. CBHHK59/15]